MRSFRSFSFLTAVMVCGLVVAGVRVAGQQAPPAGAPPAGGRQGGAAPTNLKVLPKDIARPALTAMMRGYQSSLGVQCNHCHVEDMAARAALLACGPTTSPVSCQRTPGTLCCGRRARP